MYKILLVSHGTIAKGFYDTLPMLVGTQTDVSYACLEEDDSLEQFQSKIEHQLLYDWKKDKVLVLADMENGTPSRIAAQIAAGREPECVVLCGLNLNMLLEVILRRSGSIEEMKDDVLEACKPSFMELCLQFDLENE